MKIIMIKRRVKNCHFRAVLHIGPGGSLKLWSEFSISLIEWKQNQCDQVFYRPFHEFSTMQTLPALNIQGIVGTPGAHIWDTWNTFELAPRPYLGRQLTFTAPTKCDPSAGHYSGHPSPLLGLNLRKFGDNLNWFQGYLVVYHGHVIPILIKTISLW